MTDPAGALPGTLDLLILKATSLGKLHGYGVLFRIEQISGGALQIQQGALYPALYRLEHQGTAPRPDPTSRSSPASVALRSGSIACRQAVTSSHTGFPSISASARGSEATSHRRYGPRPGSTFTGWSRSTRRAW